MTIHPIIPIWLMAILCIALLCLKRKGVFPYIRQIIIILLLFVINLRIMVPNGEVTTVKRNIDILFVVDNTISMMAEDYGYDMSKRMDAVREDCSYIMEQLPGASFSVVAFGNTVSNLTPYTIDTTNIEQALKTLNGQVTLYATGTAFDDVLDYLEKFLNNDNDHYQIVFFISDGEITLGDSMKSHPNLKQYIDGGAVLGYGTKEGGKMHAYAFTGQNEEPEELTYYDENYNVQPALSKIDEDNLKAIASDMGVDYIHMTSQSQINQTLATLLLDISKVETEESKEAVDGYNDTFYYFLIPLIPLLVFDFIYYKRKIQL